MNLSEITEGIALLGSSDQKRSGFIRLQQFS